MRLGTGSLLLALSVMSAEGISSGWLDLDGVQEGP